MSEHNWQYDRTGSSRAVCEYCKHIRHTNRMPGWPLCYTYYTRDGMGSLVMEPDCSVTGRRAAMLDRSFGRLCAVLCAVTIASVLEGRMSTIERVIRRPAA